MIIVILGWGTFSFVGETYLSSNYWVKNESYTHAFKWRSHWWCHELSTAPGMVRFWARRLSTGLSTVSMAET